MQITTTKKLKGVLDMPTIGIQMEYDHKNDKPQVKTVSDEYYGSNELQAAQDLKLITLSNIPKEMHEYDEAEEKVLSARVKNTTKVPILLSFSSKNGLEIPAGSTVTIDIQTLENFHMQAILKTGKLVVIEQDHSIEKTNENIPMSLDDEPVKKAKIKKIKKVKKTKKVKKIKKAKKTKKENETVAVVANPNKDEIVQTEQSIESKNAEEQKTQEPDLSTKMTVYSPDTLPDEDEKNDSDISFVDKEQEEKRIKELSLEDEIDEDNIGEMSIEQTKPMEGTTPLIVRQTKTATGNKKTSKKTKTAKKITEKETNDTPSKKKRMKRGEIFDLDG